MKVNDPNGTGITGVTKNQNTNRRSESQRLRGTSVASDEAQISNLSSVLRALQTQSPERAARLNHLSLEVGSGSYGIDSYLVGGGVIRESLSAIYS